MLIILNCFTTCYNFMVGLRKSTAVLTKGRDHCGIKLALSTCGNFETSKRFTFCFCGIKQLVIKLC